MNAALRRRHFRLWVGLLLVLPLLVLLGLLARPEQPSQAASALAAPPLAGEAR
jgi:hypothetical protein